MHYLGKRQRAHVRITRGLTDERDELVEVVEPRLVPRYDWLGTSRGSPGGGIGGVLGLRNGGEVGWSSVTSNWREEASFPVVSDGYG